VSSAFNFEYPGVVSKTQGYNSPGNNDYFLGKNMFVIEASYLEMIWVIDWVFLKLYNRMASIIKPNELPLLYGMATVISTCCSKPFT